MMKAGSGKKSPGANVEMEKKAGGRTVVSNAWVQVFTQGFGYISAVLILIVFVAGIMQILSEAGRWRRAGIAGKLHVIERGNLRASVGEDIPVPYEGMMGSSRVSDIFLPSRGVHLRSAFFWVDEGQLHVVPVRRDGMLADNVPVSVGDEAVLRNGAVLNLGTVRMKLTLYESAAGSRGMETPYVTGARRRRVKQGREIFIGSPFSLRRERRNRQPDRKNGRDRPATDSSKRRRSHDSRSEKTAEKKRSSAAQKSRQAQR